MRRTRAVALLLVAALASCGPGASQSAQATATLSPWSAGIVAPGGSAPLPVEERVSALLSEMTLAEKIGQMTQVEKNSIREGDITRYFIGSILSGGGGYPDPNTPEAWASMVDAFQREALTTRLAIPILYGVDAVHGHGNLHGATIFPHEIGLGATRDAELVRRIGQATAEEMLATGIPWNFAPVVAVTQDIRWGRTYESYGEDAALVTELGQAYIQGLQSIPEGFAAAAGQDLFVLATPKHFLGDGGTAYGTSTQVIFKPYLLDQGDMRLDEAGIRGLFLPPYQAAVESGARSVMVSFSSWNGVKMHAQDYWITDVLKGELGFQGFVVSDWGGMDQISSDYYDSIVTGVNAGIDMNMVPYDYLRFLDTMTQAVHEGDISLARIDDAVRRILTVKMELGLFERTLRQAGPARDCRLDSASRSGAPGCARIAGLAEERLCHPASGKEHSLDLRRRARCGGYRHAVRGVDH